jgi:damage-control phosphatase, subfamily I
VKARPAPHGGIGTSLDCIPCLVRQGLEATRGVASDAPARERMARSLLHAIAEMDFDRSPPFVVQAMHRSLRAWTDGADPYQAVKSRFNRLALDALPGLAARVAGSADPLLAAARFAAAANAIDVGTSRAFTEADLREALVESPPELVCGPGEQAFRDALARATRILYLADNAGEIAVDRLLVEQIGAARVTVAVRGAPVLNDATIADAREVGLCQMVEVIDNGSDAPGTILGDCSPSFRERFAGSDLVIAKGQGNFETLNGVAEKVFFLFKVKCPIVAAHVGFPVGAHVLVNGAS